MTRSFQRFAGWSALAAAAAGLTFTVAFSVVVREGDQWAKWAPELPPRAVPGVTLTWAASRVDIPTVCM
jgi:hypothetical protein